uniref:Uncharacterized protein n=1 Tax=Parascaris equorum TaxID=6256 RepID=A0A914RND0_PAREQ
MENYNIPSRANDRNHKHQLSQRRDIRIKELVNTNRAHNIDLLMTSFTHITELTFLITPLQRNIKGIRIWTIHSKNLNMMLA